MTTQDMRAVCGLDCDSCSIRRFPFDSAAAEEAIPWYRSQGWLKENEGVPEALQKGMVCHGCRGDRAAHWSADCWILRCCVDDKALTRCSECAQFPCDRLVRWSMTDTTYAEALRRLHASQAETRQPSDPLPRSESPPHDGD